MGFVERGPAPGRRRAPPAARSALGGRASATPARASVQTESPRVQLLALRSPDRAADSPERRLPRVRRVLYLVGAIVFVDTMFFAALTPLLPQYAAEFGIGKTGWGLLQAAYPAGALVGAIPSGMVAARAGVKPTVIVGLCCIALTSTAFGFADSVWQLDLARFAQGLASSFSWTGALAWLVAAAPPGRADRNGVRPGDRRRALRADPRRDRLDRRHGPHVHRGRRDRAAAGPVGLADAGSDARAAAARLPSVPGDGG